MGDTTRSNIDELIDRALKALDDEELDAAESILDDVKGLAGENHVRVLHLEGMIAWARGDIEHATGFLMQAADMGGERGDIHLDCAECLFMVDEVEEAEAQVRTALASDDLTNEQRNEAKLLLAQVRLADDDPDESLEVLQEIDAGLREHPAYLSTHGAALLASGKYAEAVAELEKAIAREANDGDLHYQLAIALERAGDIGRAREEMVKVLELDLKDIEEAAGQKPPEPDYAEIQELRSTLEDVFEQLPDPVLKLVASAPITVQAHASPEQVRSGINPRSIVTFLGTPKQSDEEEAELQGIVIMRDLLMSEVDDEDEVEAELFYALMEEIQYFFKRDDIVVGEA